MQIILRCLNKNLTHISEELARSKEDFIQNHFSKYDSPTLPPAWKTLEVTSFGTLSKLYYNLKDKGVKRSIARELGFPQHLYLEKAIHPNSAFVGRIKTLISEQPDVDVAAMGFPKSWENETLWK